MRFHEVKVSTSRILGQIKAALDETSWNVDRLSLLKVTLKKKLDTLMGLDAEII